MFEKVTVAAMKRVELKRVLEILGKGHSADEKTPFASRGTLPKDGSYSNNLESQDDIKKSKEFPENEGDALPGPMSGRRKFAFVMSFNVWILYFVALGWLIPCRNLDCTLPYPDIVETNLSNIWILTNLETMNVKGLPSLAMIGYGNGTELKLGALETFDATSVWDNNLPFIPRTVQCNFGNTFDVNADGIPDCLLLGFNDLYTFNASNGYVFWHQSIPSEEGNILSKFHPTSTRNGESFLIGTCGDKLVVADARNGSKVSEVSLPCEAPFEIRIVSNKINDSHATWNLICDYGDKVEAWSFKEENVLKGEKIEKNANISEFTLLFSGANSGGSIDLGCDVTPIPGGPLLLSWSDRVVMVTQESTAWERYFPEPLTVASIKVGHFSKTKETLIAAAVHNSTNTVIYIMETKNGTILDSTSLQNSQAQSMEKIVDDIDLLVLRSRSLNYTSSEPESNYTDPIPAEQTNFALIDFSSGKLKVKDILTTGIVVSSALNMQRNGETDLLVIKTENGFTSYVKYILHEVVSKDKVICLGGGNGNHRHHYPLEA